MNEISTPEPRQGHLVHSLLSIEHLPHYMKVAEMLSKSTMIPKNMIGKPADILIAMDMALQLGIPLLQGIQDIAVINGKPSLYGDALLSVVQSHKDYEWIKESVDNGVGICTIKRKGHEPHTSTFSIEDAKKAGLWGKQGPWSQYPERMLKMRARGFAIRDIFSDALRGVKTEEEVQDYPRETKMIEEDLKTLIGQSVVDVSAVELSPALISESQLSSLRDFYAEAGAEKFNSALKSYNVNSVQELTFDQANELMEVLRRDL